MNTPRLVLLAVLVAAGVVQAQDPRLADVLKWKGTISGIGRMTEADFPPYIDPIPGLTIDYTASFTASVELERVQGDAQRWEGRVVSSTFTARYREEYRYCAGNSQCDPCVRTITADTAGPLDDAYTPPDARLEIFRDFTLNIYRLGRPANFTQTTVCAGGFNSTRTWQSKMDIENRAQNLPLPTTGFNLSGTATSISEVTFAGNTGGSRPAKWQVTVNLNPDSTETLTLWVANTPAYQRWRPKTTADGAAGPPLPLTATLVSSTGQEPFTGVQTWTWELLGTSKEPGVALNYPVDAPEREFDLELEASGKTVESSPDKQRVLNVANSGFTDTVKVLPKDWGAWSELKVTATLLDGRKVVGKLRGATEENVRLPRRSPSSFIADAWKEATGGSGGDGDDFDALPRGDGTPGDGLSLYEEYRGFYEGGVHVEGKPKKKDFFIRNKEKAAAEGGIVLFARVSQLEVHSTLTDSELHASRVINRNHAVGPHVTDQHAIVMDVDPTLVNWSFSFGGPGNPKAISRVGLLSNWEELSDAKMATVVAHELFHCVNVWHHGEADYDAVWGLDDQKNLVEYLEGQLANRVSISPLTEQWGELTTRYTQYLSQPAEDGGVRLLRGNIGVNAGRHSGNDACVMRYFMAVAVVGRDDPKMRFVVQESFGAGLCTQAMGTGVNKPGRTPQPRYGDAQTGRGDCVHQLLVTDAATAPRR